MHKINTEYISKIKGNVIPPLTTILAVASIGIATIAMYKLFTSKKGKIELAKNFGVSWN